MSFVLWLDKKLPLNWMKAECDGTQVLFSGGVLYVVKLDVISQRCVKKYTHRTTRKLIWCVMAFAWLSSLIMKKRKSTKLKAIRFSYSPAGFRGRIRTATLQGQGQTIGGKGHWSCDHGRLQVLDVAVVAGRQLSNEYLEDKLSKLLPHAFSRASTKR